MSHGQFIDYRRGCRCQECVEANRTYQREWYRRKRNGTSNRVSAAAAHKHVKFLVRTGMTRHAIADIAHVKHATVCDIGRLEHKRIERTTSDAILGVGMHDLPSGRRKQWLPASMAIPLYDIMAAGGMTTQDVIRTVGAKPHVVRQQTFVQLLTYQRAVIVCRMLAKQGLIPAEMLGEVGV